MFYICLTVIHILWKTPQTNIDLIPTDKYFHTSYLSFSIAVQISAPDRFLGNVLQDKY